MTWCDVLGAAQYRGHAMLDKIFGNFLLSRTCYLTELAASRSASAWL
jgi:hypothetical protein